MEYICQHLIIRIGVNRGHDAVLHSNTLVQRLDKRCKTVRRARCVRNDLVIDGKRVMVHPVYNRLFNACAAGCRDDDLLRTALDVLPGGFLRAEKTGRLEDAVNIQVTPGLFRRVPFGEHTDTVTIDDDVTTIYFDSARELAMRRVIPRQMCVRICVAEIIQCHNIEFAGPSRFVNRTKNVATDAAVSIDTDFDSHL